MREKVDAIAEAVDSLMVLADQYRRGQCVPWDEIETIAGNRKENRPKAIITKWRKRLEREREIVTLAADNVGIRLLTHKETAAEIPRIRQRKAYKQIRRALKQTSLVDGDKLSDHERRLLASQRSNMAEQRRELFRSQKQLREKQVATETNPRRLQTA